VSDLVFASYPVYKVMPDRIAGLDRDLAAKEVAELFDEFSDRVETRGLYSTAGFTAQADLMVWWVTRSATDVQDLTTAFRRTQLGSALTQIEAWLGLVRPAEFSPDHLPSFVAGKDPKPYLCVYPFVRTPEWYLLDPQERAKLLREHGEAARAFSDVQANTKVEIPFVTGIRKDVAAVISDLV
jgi:hydrogen peroxide-dependent heme synthase